MSGGAGMEEPPRPSRAKARAVSRYEHLQLVRLPERFERRRTGGGGRGPQRNPGEHSARLRTELEQAVATQQQRRRPEFVDPSLILRVKMTTGLLEEDWNRLGLTVLSSDEDRTLVLFSSSGEMSAFEERLASYGRGTPPGQQNPSYAAFVGGIESSVWSNRAKSRHPGTGGRLLAAQRLSGWHLLYVGRRTVGPRETGAATAQA